MEGICDLVPDGNITITINVEPCSVNDVGYVDIGHYSSLRLLVDEVRLEYLPLSGM